MNDYFGEEHDPFCEVPSSEDEHQESPDDFELSNYNDYCDMIGDEDEEMLPYDDDDVDFDFRNHLSREDVDHLRYF